VSAPAGGPAGVPAPAAVAVDVAVFTVRDGTLRVLLAQARSGPFAGWWALPGGRVGEEESLDEAAARELPTTAAARDVYLEQLYTFGHPQRDPRGRVVSVAYVGLVADAGDVSGPAAGKYGGKYGGKYAAVAWHPPSRLPRLAYDHAAVVRLAVTRLRAKLQYTNLVYTLLPRTFTLRELQALYEAILGRHLDRRNFRRRVLSLGLLRPLGRLRRGAHRPAALYAFRTRRPMIVTIL
jgi:8-oxo-dGTP diphosphatase